MIVARNSFPVDYNNNKELYVVETTCFPVILEQRSIQQVLEIDEHEFVVFELTSKRLEGPLSYKRSLLRRLEDNTTGGENLKMNN